MNPATTLHPDASRSQRRARRLVELARLRAHVERRLARDGAFHGPVKRQHLRASWTLDAINAETFAVWEAA